MTFRYEAEERWKGTNQRKGSEDNQIERLKEPEGLQLIVGLVLSFFFFYFSFIDEMFYFPAITHTSHRAEPQHRLHTKRESCRKSAFCRYSNWQTIVSAGSKNKVGTIANNFTFGRESGDEEIQERRKTSQQRQSL